MGILNWLTYARRKQRALRHATPGLVAYYWDGGVPKEHAVKNISLTGAYLYAAERWYDGTIMALSFRQGAITAEAACLSVRGKIVRHGADGIGIKFMMRTKDEKAALKRFINHKTERGQALVEYALMVPLLLLFVVTTVNFGGLLYSWVTVANAARAGSQYAAMGAAYATYPAPGSLSAIKTLVQNETSALPHSSSSNPAVTVCENNNGTVTNWGGGTCPAGVTPPQDPETITGGQTGTTYTSLAIDVTYTYTAIISTGFKFPALNIVTLAMPTTVHRRTVMRVLN